MVLMRTTIPTVPMMATVVKTTMVSTNVLRCDFSNWGTWKKIV